MDFVFDKLDTTTCAGCGGSVDVADLPAFKTVACPHCKAEVRVPGKLGGLLLQEVVGVGSAGIVYRALDVTLNRGVAVKILKNEEGDDKKIVQATVAEARALAAINHPNVVHIHTIGMRHGQPYIVMELLVGADKLNVMLREGWVADEKRGLEIALDVAQGLKAAQGAGLLHRDVKPGNILFNNEGVAKLLDFSVVHAATGDGEKLVIGTPYYIAPEAARGNEVDFRSDIYSLGATVFHLLTGRPVFDGESSRDVMRARLKQRAPDVRKLKPAITGRAAGILARMLETDAADRYGSYDELIADLRLALDQLVHGEPEDVGGIRDFEQVLAQDAVPVATPRRSRAAAAPPPPKQNAGLLIGLAAAGIAVVAGVAIFLATSGGENDDDRLASKDAAGATDADTPRRPAPTLVSPASIPGTGATTDPAPDPTPGVEPIVPPPPPDPAVVDPPVQPPTPTPVAPPKEDPFITALRAWERATAAQLIREPTVWQPVKWTAVRSEGGATLTPGPDGTITAGGTNPATDTYVLELKLTVPADQITGLRIDALAGDGLPQKGPGRFTNGNFVLTNVAAQVIPAADPSAARTYLFAAPTAEFEQPNFPAAALIDADPQTGWATFPRVGQSNAVMLPVQALPPATPAPKRPVIVFDDFEGAGFDAKKWTVTGDAFKDRPFKDGEIVLPGLANFAGQHMANSALGTGLGVNSASNQRGTGTLTSAPFQIERHTLTFLLAGGNKQTTRVELKVDGNVVHKAVGDRSLKLAKVAWDVRAFAGKEATIAIIDEEEKDTRGYIIVDQIELSDEPAGAAAEGDGEVLRVTLAHQSKSPQHALGRFRVSLTTSKDPFLDAKLPANIKAILALSSEKRTSAQAKELEDYFRRTKIDGLSYVPPGASPPKPPAPPVASTAPKAAPVNPAAPAKPAPAAPKLAAYLPAELASLKDNSRTYDAPGDAWVLVPRYEAWAVWLSPEAPPANWAAANFVAGGWQLEPASLGYGYDSLKSQPAMKGKFTSVYARVPIKLDKLDGIGDLLLGGRFDDAIIVYVNGKEVYRTSGLTGAGGSARVGPETPRATSRAAFVLKDSRKLLAAGVNWVAIECHNISADDADFVFDPYIAAERIRPLNPATKHLGWSRKDAEWAIDDDGITLQGKGKEPRLETTELKVDGGSTTETIFIRVTLTPVAAGKVKFAWKAKAGDNETEDDDLVAVTGNKEQTITGRARIKGKMTFLRIDGVTDKGQALIKSIRIFATNGKVLQEWEFAKAK